MVDSPECLHCILPLPSSRLRCMNIFSRIAKQHTCYMLLQTLDSKQVAKKLLSTLDVSSLSSDQCHIGQRVLGCFVQFPKVHVVRIGLGSARSVATSTSNDSSPQKMRLSQSKHSVGIHSAPTSMCYEFAFSFSTCYSQTQPTACRMQIRHSCYIEDLLGLLPCWIGPPAFADPCAGVQQFQRGHQRFSVAIEGTLLLVTIVTPAALAPTAPPPTLSLNGSCALTLSNIAGRP